MHSRSADEAVELLANRFLPVAGRWFDAATAREVAVLIRPAGERRAQIDWSERCAALARLRHPALNALLDFGVADRVSFFEAYAVAPALLVPPGGRRLVAAHVSRFLAAHGVELAPDQALLAMRPLRGSAAVDGVRPVGFVLQARGAVEAVEELLACPPRGGVARVGVRGAAGAGLRTSRDLLAQQARVLGYVPVCGEALARWPALAAFARDRHVCLLDAGPRCPGSRTAGAALLADLGVRSARSHVRVAFERREDDGAAAISLGWMGIKAMQTMIYVDPEEGPGVAELFAAARQAAGLPGPFLAALAARTAGRRPHLWAVHESAVEYRPDPASEPARAAPAGSRTRITSTLWRAASRAAALEARGRHAAAARLLLRAARVLQRRGDTAQAARCWLQLAWLARSRGATKDAAGYAASARDSSAAPAVAVEAGVVTAVCWTDEERLLEADACLRSQGAAALDLGEPVLAERCTLALARTFYWRGHAAEMIDVLGPLRLSRVPEHACEAALLASRAHLACGDLPGALDAAREGLPLARATADARLHALAERTMAEGLAAAGDCEGAHAHAAEGIRIASMAHQALGVLKLRIALLRGLRERADPADTARLRHALRHARRRPLPALLVSRLEAACAIPARPEPPPAWQPSPLGVSDVEAFLDVAQRAQDDESALRDVAAAVCERVGAIAASVVAADGRTIAASGRPWRDGSIALAQALASGASVRADPGRQPPEAAEPVRCGGELIGALACRWVTASVFSAAGVQRALKAAALVLATHLRAVVEGSPAPDPPAAWGDLLGESPAAAALRDAVARAARAPYPVLVEGESGSGKELVARAVHRLGARRTRRFCAINCAALSDELVEAELFGHTRGAFTGATTERTGLFEEADGGTLFLDEVGELSARAQAKLLRVLQEGEVRRVGENLPRRVDARVVAATNRGLEAEAAAGRFRADLRFRLDVLRIVVPPLRDRPGDIPILAQHFWRQACAKVGSAAVLSQEAMAALARYDWPGNVRELQNAIAWIAVHAPRRGRVGAGLLPRHLASSPLATGSFEAAREEFERRFVRAALAQAGGQRQAAARALGMSRQGLAKMLRRLGIESV